MIDGFLAPERLVLLALVVVFAVAYVAVLRWRSHATVRFTQVDLLDAVIPARPQWRRHAVAGLNLAGLAVGVVAIAQPASTDSVRVGSEGRIMVLFDVSSSMAATDVAPDRFSAAKTAAEQFIDQVEADIEVGLISFSGDVTVETPPTLDRSAVTGALARLQLAPSTAIGDALIAGTNLLVSLQDQPTDSDATVTDDAGAADDVSPGAIVLLTDGETTIGATTAEGAQVAADANVPVFTISFGTAEGTITDPTTGQILAVPVQPEPLEEAAAVTGGQSYEAASPAELADAYAEIRELLDETLGQEVEVVTEQTWMVTAVAVGLFALAWALALWWLRGLV